MIVAVSALIAVALVAVIVGLGRRAGILVRTAALGLAGAVAIWAGALWLISTGWNDIDGFIDCYGYCHGWHYVGGILFVTPSLVALLLALVLFVSGVRALRDR